MIDKKEVVSWFKELESYKRIDAMYTLIGMCLPFELRFLGSVLEELGRRDSQELRGIEVRVTNPQDLAADIASCQNGEPTDKKIRRKMAIYLALIRACSRTCVNELFRTLENWGEMDFIKFGDVENTLEELLLVYTMASLHPVFSFDQRNKCADILSRIEECQRLLHNSQQQQQQQHHHHQQTTPQDQHSTSSSPAAVPAMVQGHMVTGHQPMHAPMQVLPPTYHYTMQQPPLNQMFTTDGTVPHTIPVEGIPMIPANLSIPAEYTVAPPGHWPLRHSVLQYTAQQPSSMDFVLQQHPPQSPSSMLSQQSSPSHSRTASPSRSTTGGNNASIMQQSTQQQSQQQQQQSQQQQQHNRSSQQQQQQSQRNNTLRNSRRPSAETTPPPPAMQQQQTHHLPPNQLIIQPLANADMLPPQSKNLDDMYNADGTLALQCRNGYTRSGHHTIPRQSKSSHHNQQQQQHQQQQHHNQHIPNIANLIGIGGLVGGAGGLISPLQQSGVSTAGNFNLPFQLHNMSLSDIHNSTATLVENNLVISSNNSNSSNRHHNKSGESDSGNSIGSSAGDISPPDTPAALSSVVNNSNMSSNSSIRLNDQNNFSKHNLNMTRLNGRPDKLLSASGGGLVDVGVISSSSGSGGGVTTVLYTPVPISSQQQQQFIGNDLILTTGPNLMPSPVANNNNNSSLSSTGNSGSCSNNNLVTSTQVMLTTPTGSGVVSNVITTNPVILQHQPFSATYPYPAQHLSTTRPPPILSHNAAAPAAMAAGIPPPLQYRHPGFQIPNGEPPTVYQYPAQVPGGPATQFLLTAAPPQPPSGVLRPPQPSQSQSQTASQQQSQSQQPQSTQQLPQQGAQPQPPPVAPSSILAINPAPYTTLPLGANKLMSCFNCGSQSHTGRECQEASMEDITRSIYILDYNQSASPTTTTGGGGHGGHGGGGGGGNGGGMMSHNSNTSSSSSSSGGGSGPGSGVSTAEIATETSSPTSSSSSLSNSNIK